MQAWEVANNNVDAVASPFIACETSGSSGYERHQLLNQIFSSGSGSSLAEHPLYNKSEKTCYHVMVPSSFALEVEQQYETLTLQIMAPVMKIRKGTIMAASTAAVQERSNVKINVEFGPGVNVEEASSNILKRLQNFQVESSQVFIAESFPYSGMEKFTLESFEEPESLFSNLSVPEGGMGNHSIGFVVKAQVKSRADLLAVVGGIASQPEVISVEVGQMIGQF